MFYETVLKSIHLLLLDTKRKSDKNSFVLAKVTSFLSRLNEHTIHI